MREKKNNNNILFRIFFSSYTETKIGPWFQFPIPEPNFSCTLGCALFVHSSQMTPVILLMLSVWLWGVKNGFSFALNFVCLFLMVPVMDVNSIKSPSITECLQIFRPSTGSASKVSAVPLLYYCTLLCSPALCIMPALVLNMK